MTKEFPRFCGKRSSWQMDIADKLFFTALIITGIFIGASDIVEFLQANIGVSRFWGYVITFVGIILIFHIEQFITFHIDRRISERSAD